MNHLSILLITVLVLVSCTEKKSSSLKAFEDLQKQVANDTTTLKKLSKRYDSLKLLYGDSLIYVSDIYTSGIDTSKRKKIEDKIIDTIIGLKEVKNKADYVKRQTNGQRHLQYMIWQKPTPKNHIIGSKFWKTTAQTVTPISIFLSNPIRFKYFITTP